MSDISKSTLSWEGRWLLIFSVLYLILFPTFWFFALPESDMWIFWTISGSVFLAVLLFTGLFLWFILAELWKKTKIQKS